MKRLYKHEIWFAIIWIIIYVVGTSIADFVSVNLGIEKMITLPFHIILCIILGIWLGKNRLTEKYGLCRTKVAAKRFLYYIPLIIISTCNLWMGVALNFSVMERILYFFSMLCVGFLEEVIFRGFLFKAMCKSNIRAAIIVSSITFGIGHIVNLMIGMELIANLCQVCYAVAIGFLFVIIFYRGNSLLPCIFTHSAINALSVFANVEKYTNQIQIITSVILCVLAVSYLCVLMKTLPKVEDEVSD